MDTLLADYRAAWKQFSTATLPSPLFASHPHCPVFSPTDRSRLVFFPSLSSLFSFRGSVRAQARLPGDSIGTRALSPSLGRTQEGVEFCSFPSTTRFPRFSKCRPRTRRNPLWCKRIVTTRRRESRVLLFSWWFAAKSKLLPRTKFTAYPKHSALERRNRATSFFAFCSHLLTTLESDCSVSLGRSNCVTSRRVNEKRF